MDYGQAWVNLRLDPARPLLVAGRPHQYAPEITAEQKYQMGDPNNLEHLVLLPWQVQGVMFLIHMERAKTKGSTLGDEMGLGKTITALVYMVTAPLYDLIKAGNYGPEDINVSKIDFQPLEIADGKCPLLVPGSLHSTQSSRS